MVIILPLIIVTITTAVYLFNSSKFRRTVVTTVFSHSYTKFMENRHLLCLYYQLYFFKGEELHLRINTIGSLITA